MKTSLTWFGNQWTSDTFWLAVAAEVDEASKTVEGFEYADTERVVLASWLNYAIPAGNA